MGNRFYSMCRNNIGKNARVHTKDGQIYTGVISKVTRQSLHLSGTGVGINGKESASSHAKVKTAVGTPSKELAKEVFFFPGIVPLAAIAGLTFVGASPYFGGYGYGGYGGYGYYGGHRPYGYGSGYRPNLYGPFRRRGFYW